MLGDWFKRSGKRDKIVLATKVGMDMGDGERGLARDIFSKRLKLPSGACRQTTSTSISPTRTMNPSHRRHWKPYEQLIQQGKVRAIGASNFKGSRLSEAIEVRRRRNCRHIKLYNRSTTLQPPAIRDRPSHRSQRNTGSASITYFSLASGFLTGKYKRRKTQKERIAGRGF